MYKKYEVSQLDRLAIQAALVEKGGTLLPNGDVQAPVTGYWPVREWAWNGTLWSDAAGLVSTASVFWPVPDTDGSPQGLTSEELTEYVKALAGELTPSVKRVEWTGRFILHTDRYGWTVSNSTFDFVGEGTVPQRGDAIHHRQIGLVDKLATVLCTDGRVLPTDTGGAIQYAVG